MNNSDYTPIAMRGGLGDILLYSLKIWGNGFWKYIIVGFFFIIPLLISVMLFNFFFPETENIFTNQTIIEKSVDSSETPDKTTEDTEAKDAEESVQSNPLLSINPSFFAYLIISIIIIFYFLCLSMGANSYIAGKYSVGEKPSTADALSYSLTHSGSYFIYSILFTIITILLFMFSLYINSQQDGNAALYGEVMNWVFLISGIVFIFLSPLLILVFPGMIFMRTNIFNAFKGVGKLLKAFYSRALSVFIISIVLVSFILLVFLNNAIIGSIAEGLFDFSRFSAMNMVWLLIMVFIPGITYGFFSTVVSLTFLNVWACKLGLENIYAIKILSAALNKRKIPKNWYRNKDINQLQSRKKVRVKKLNN
jgi:hypothetical protein